VGVLDKYFLLKYRIKTTIITIKIIAPIIPPAMLPPSELVVVDELYEFEHFGKFY
jgi:hypothetical protein